MKSKIAIDIDVNALDRRCCGKRCKYQQYRASVYTGLRWCSAEALTIMDLKNNHDGKPLRSRFCLSREIKPMMKVRKS